MNHQETESMGVSHQQDAGALGQEGGDCRNRAVKGDLCPAQLLCEAATATPARCEHPVCPWGSLWIPHEHTYGVVLDSCTHRVCTLDSELSHSQLGVGVWTWWWCPLTGGPPCRAGIVPGIAHGERGIDTSVPQPRSWAPGFTTSPGHSTQERWQGATQTLKPVPFPSEHSFPVGGKTPSVSWKN